MSNSEIYEWLGKNFITKYQLIHSIDLNNDKDKEISYRYYIKLGDYRIEVSKTMYENIQKLKEE